MVQNTNADYENNQTDPILTAEQKDDSVSQKAGSSDNTKVKDKSGYSPMMQHYLELKEQYPDVILMYRLGDFYEMFFEDARTASKELDLVLTARAAGCEKAPMCGVPHHAVNHYIARLIHKGYKVAICEQLEDPKEAKGLVDRGIVKIVTPGTFMEEDLNAKTSNYFAVIACSSYQAALLFCELSTGELLYQIVSRNFEQVYKSLQEMNVSEVVFDKSLDRSWQNRLQSQSEFVCSVQKPVPLKLSDEKLLSIQEPVLESALSILSGYLQNTLMQHADYLQPLRPLHPMECMQLDCETKKHLELTYPTSSRSVSLWAFMDHTRTSMGSRLLRSWIESPLCRLDEIERRLDAVEIFVDQFMFRESMKEYLSHVYDLERLAGRISMGSAGPRDVLQIIKSLQAAAPILELARENLSGYREFENVDALDDLYAGLKDALNEDLPPNIKDGGVIAPGYCKELDEIRQLADQSAEAVLKMENEERERTGIKALKIGYNRVFGYYIEVRKGSLGQIKDEFGYSHRQTLSNASRFTTTALKNLENEILAAQEKKSALENELFSRIVASIHAELPKLMQLAGALSILDVFCSCGLLAVEKGYIRPGFNNEHEVSVIEGRHPIMEEKIDNYISNDWLMPKETDIQLITGPNMGGKSTFLRQNALIAIMAQAGSFIPAKSASLPVFDRIFTRIGANDDIMSGKSTFMVEMMEANAALRYASENSLILFDEIGRGTATYDGMALAQAMLEYIDEAIHAKMLFSTHYHELTDLDQAHSAIENIHVDVKEKDGQISFLYRIVPGKADKSYGIHVASLASLPSPVISRAEMLLDDFEKQNQNEKFQPNLFIMDRPAPSQNLALCRLKETDLDNLSAREALSFLYELQELAQKDS